MGLFASVRQSWLRRNTLFFASVFGAALVTELAMDSGIEKYWEIHNKGKLWKDVEAGLMKNKDNEEDEE